MFLGTGSDVGKSVTVTAFCRILKNQGWRVVPFKAQNMSNNSFVTIEGGEIGRAQAAQAEAAGVPPSFHMNPVLLKPNSEKGSQVVLQGQVYGNMTAMEYYTFKPMIKDKIMASYRRLEEEYDVIVMEGAGSAAEVNLRDHDVVNFDMALSVKAPVILIADIDRGGVFAQIIGSLEVISPKEKKLVQGFIINRFRGDPELFKNGIEYIEQRTGKPVFGLVPFFKGYKINAEDSVSLDRIIEKREPESDRINIGVIRVPHVSNFTDLEVLDQEPEVTVAWLTDPETLRGYDVIVLPGTKSTINDMKWLHDTGWTEIIKKYAEAGGWVVGVCGGFQMLGKKIYDPQGIEGTTKEIDGMGLIDAVTLIKPTKVVRRTRGRDRLFGEKVCGYEIHMGCTELGTNVHSFLELENGADGAMNSKETVFGTYLHGLFDAGKFRKRFLENIAGRKGVVFDRNRERADYWAEKDKHYNALADQFSEYLDVEGIIRVMKKQV